MLQAQLSRRSGSVRLLRAGPLHGVRPVADGCTHRLLGGLCDGARAQCPGHPAIARQERAKREGERVLLLFDGGAVGGRGGGGVVHVAGTVPHLFHGSVCAGLVRCGILVSASCAATESRFVSSASVEFEGVRRRGVFRPTRGCKIATLSRKFWFDDLSGRIGFPLFTHLERPAFPLPNGGGPVRP